jgi:hypothetical protein
MSSDTEHSKENVASPNDGDDAEQVAPAESTAVNKKRPAVEVETAPDDSVDTSRPKKPCTETTNTVDLAVHLGFQPGDRIEVQWEVGDIEKGEQLTRRWWGATLMEHDGRVLSAEDDEGPPMSLAIRVLDYDPYPEGGFPERMRESVVFTGDNTLSNPEDDEVILVFRREGEEAVEDDEPIFRLSDSEMEEYVNSIMISLFDKHSDTIKQLPAAQQAMIAERLKIGKEKFLDALAQLGSGAHVTAEKIQELLAQAVSEE